MDDATAHRIDQINARSIEHVDAAIATVERVIEASRLLAQVPDHAETAERRIRDGERELAFLQAERAALEQGDTAAALRIAEQFRSQRSRH